jgi:hypothetical protein
VATVVVPYHVWCNFCTLSIASPYINMISCKAYWICKEPGHVDYANLLCVFLYLPSYIPCCVLPLVSSRMAKDASDTVWNTYTGCRSSRHNQHHNGQFADSEGQWVHMESGPMSSMESATSWTQSENVEHWTLNMVCSLRPPSSILNINLKAFYFHARSIVYKMPFNANGNPFEC